MLILPLPRTHFSEVVVAKLHRSPNHTAKYFECRSAPGNTVGFKLLESAVLQTNSCERYVNSWGVTCLLVKEKAVPSIVSYLLPKLRESGQRILLDSASLIIDRDYESSKVKVILKLPKGSP